MAEIRTIRYDDGRWCEQEYDGDQLHGRWTVFYANGTKEWERQHVNDRKEGYFKRWGENGRLIEEIWYHLNELHGAWQKWDEKGVEELVGEYVLGYPKHIFDATVNPDFNTLIKPSYGLEPAEFATKADGILSSLARPSLRIKKATHLPVDRSKRGSFWNHVNVLGAGERWPRFEGQALFPILQINCRDIALTKTPLCEFSFVTLFAAAGTTLDSLGDDIVLRAYRPDDELVEADVPCEPLDSPCTASLSDSVTSYPDDNDLPPGLVAFMKGSSKYENCLYQDEKLLSRIGGWPGWLQGGRLSMHGRFLLQVDSLDVENWDCGDCTIHYFFQHANSDGFSWVQEMC